MERTKHYLIPLLFIFISVNMAASYRTDIYNAYITNRMDLWKKVIDVMQGDNFKNDALAELINYQYGYIGYCIGFEKKDEARKYLNLAERNLEILEKGKYDPSIIKAYKCAFYGFRLGLNKFTAPVNGLKSLENAKSALAIDSTNYFAWIQYGNVQFYMPATFGGSKKEGIEYFLKAKKIMEKHPDELINNWNYLSLLVLIGQSYTYINDTPSAKRVYESILEREPAFLYVKNELYPELLKKMNN
ncbi:MAG TPA: hypothetical protein PK719_01345 [Bacteroidales bacterium]|nr:MAG: hypothetical protein BWX96_02303 [Bacteroidetes bacterium ADurb.Bin145]HOU02557.1 hypothetical protein [Bacteroidales bacterium]HQG62274.1 hypothetical protein [Bacteroidales bacterium]HQK66536.1 hypothetical protein [Bacteroidales bacterium]